MRSIREAVGVFDSADALEGALDDLLATGFDRAEVSLLASEHAVEHALGHAYRKVGELEDDATVPRAAFVATEEIGDAEGAVIGGLMYVGAVAAAGGVVASGGLMGGAVLAAALAGGAGGLIGSALARLIDWHHADHLGHQLEHGGLLLWVRTRDAAHEDRARDILRRHGAADVHVHDVAVSAIAAAESATDLERALLDPTAVFAAPRDVLARRDFTREQQVAVLERWAYDAKELEVASDEGMPAEGEDQLAGVLEALNELRAETR
jgi:hypothetical protein